MVFFLIIMLMSLSSTRDWSYSNLYVQIWIGKCLYVDQIHHLGFTLLFIAQMIRMLKMSYFHMVAILDYILLLPATGSRWIPN